MKEGVLTDNKDQSEPVEQVKTAAFANDTVSMPPFSDGADEEGSIADQVKDSESSDKGVDPKSEEGSSALESSSFEDSVSDKLDRLMNKLDDLSTLNKIDKLIDAVDSVYDQDSSQDLPSEAPVKGAPSMPDASDDLAGAAASNLGDSLPGEDEGAEDVEKTSSIEKKGSREMARHAEKTLRKFATDESGTPTDPKTSEEVLSDAVDQGDNYEAAQAESHDETPSTSAETGDNYAGSGETVSETEDLKPVTTASALRLADAYVKAGIVPESERWAAAEKLAKLTKMAARNRQSVFDAIAKTASIKKAEDEDFDAPAEADKPVYDLDGLEAGSIKQEDDGTYSYDVDGATGDGFTTEDEALDAVKDETGNDGLVTSDAVASRRRAHLRRDLKKASRIAASVRRTEARKASMIARKTTPAAVKPAPSDIKAARKAAMIAARKQAAKVRTANIAKTASAKDDVFSLI